MSVGVGLFVQVVELGLLELGLLELFLPKFLPYLNFYSVGCDVSFLKYETPRRGLQMSSPKRGF